MSKPNGDDRSHMEPRSFSATPAHAIGDKRLRKSDWRVLSALSLHADAGGYCYPSQQTLAALAAVSRKTVNDAITRLINFGYVKQGKTLKRKHGHFGNSSYFIVRKRHPLDSQPSHPKKVTRSVSPPEGDAALSPSEGDTNRPLLTDHPLNRPRYAFKEGSR